MFCELCPEGCTECTGDQRDCACPFAAATLDEEDRHMAGPSGNGPNSLGGFRGKGPRKNTMRSQRPSAHQGSGKGSKAAVVIALVIFVPPAVAVAAALGYVATHWGA